MSKVVAPKRGIQRPVELPRVRAAHFIDPRLLPLLDQAAAKEGRSRGGMIEIMVREGLTARKVIKG